MADNREASPPPLPWQTEEQREELARGFDRRVEARRARTGDAEFKRVGEDRDFAETLARLRERFGGQAAPPPDSQTALPMDQPAALVAAAEPDRDDRRTVKQRGVPEIHLRHVYDVEPFACEALAAVREFLAAEQQVFLVLVGGPGTRKSGSAAWALERGPGKFVGAAELGRIAASKAEDDAIDFRQCRRVPLLVVDEVGAEYDSDWFRSVLSDVCNARYEDLRKTILTTNLALVTDDGKPGPFVKRYGRRLCDRIREAGRVVVIAGLSQRDDFQPAERTEP